MREKDDVTQTIERVQAFVASGVLPKYKLAELAGVGVATLTGLERPDWNPRAATLAALIKACLRWEARESIAHPTLRAPARAKVSTKESELT